MLVASIALLAALFLIAKLAYLRALSLDGMARSQSVGADVMRAAFGERGAAPLALAEALAALTSANATIVTGARSAYALGGDVPALRWLDRWDEDGGGPRNAILAQGAIVLALVAAGATERNGFQLVVEYTASVFWFFLLMVGVALLVLRRREPGRERPHRVPLHPVLPLVFCAASAWLLWKSLVYAEWGALLGFGIVAVGALPLLARHASPSKLP